MPQETKQCQNCQQEFTIEPEDFEFYQKLKVPAPTWCPECRTIRRMTWRNERSLYNRQCGLTGEKVITAFGPDSQTVIYSNKAWASDQWDPLDYGLDYDFDKTFFEQFKSLLSRVPLPATFIDTKSVNSEYCNHAENLKDCYLSFGVWRDENVNYSNKVSVSKDVFDSLGAVNSELGYWLITSDRIYASAFLQNCVNCNHSLFLFDCRGCTDCLGCVNLRNKSYCILNKQYSKEEYQKEKEKLQLHTWQGLEAFKAKFQELKLKSIHRFAFLTKTENCTGDIISGAKNCHNCFEFHEAENVKNSVHGGFKMTDSADGYGVGGGAELVYEAVDTGLDGYRLLFNVLAWYSHNIEYCYNCRNCSDCFGCVSLRNKQYCILNKQYTKEEYFKTVEKIKQQMNEKPYIDKQGRVYKYGEFFPPELSPFAYNETIAQEYFSLTKEEALKEGFKWKNREKRNYAITLKTEDIPNDIQELGQSICREVIQCATQSEQERENNGCTMAFKIIPKELEFYKKMNLPLPRYCPNCRHFQRLRQKNPLKLYHRACMKEGCNNEFETTYSPDRPEIIYCERCYNEEVV